MKLYHGSSFIIQSPDIEKCIREGREFGRAFYLTPNFELAKLYAYDSAHIHNRKLTYVYEYELDEVHLCCKLMYSNNQCELWEKFIKLCQTEEYDEDNGFFRAAIGPLKQKVSLLTNLPLTKDPYIQYALKTQKVLDHLSLSDTLRIEI